MHIAGMRVRITLQKNETVTDAYGNHANVWTPCFSCWATASSQMGQEKEAAATANEEDRMDFTVRYSSETAAVVSTKYRIVLMDRIYDIDHVDDMSFRKNCIKFHAHLVKR